LKAVTEFVAMT